MKGKVFVTSTGYDPDKGEDVKDPYLGPNPSLGACRPDIRKQLQVGDQVFVVSGKVRGFDQYVIGGLEIKEKIGVLEAYERFPEQRLRLGDDGKVTGNIIVDAAGNQHELDHHPEATFEGRIKNYVVGCNPIVLATPIEVAEGRRLTLDILRDVFELRGNSIRELLGRCRNMTGKQVLKLRDHLETIKNSNPDRSPGSLLRHSVRLR
jgi:hypothetical protein